MYVSKSRGRGRRGTALLLVLLLLLTTLLIPQRNERVYAVSVSELRSEQSALEDQIAAAENDIKDLESSRDNVSAKYQWLQGRSAEIQDLYQKRLEQLNAILEIKKTLTANLISAIERYNQKVEQYGQRIEAMYRVQNKSMLELLLESNSLDGFFSTVRLMKIVADEDEEILQDLRKARDNLQAQKMETEKQLQEMQGAFDTVSQQLQEIKNDINATAANYNALDSAVQERLTQIDNYNSQYKELSNQIAAEQAKFYASHPSLTPNPGVPSSIKLQYTGGSLGWPCPQNQGITSYFGWRSIPELGLNDFHTGLDFAANVGTPVYAACSGTVTVAGMFKIGGNMIRIATGTGLDTLYAHLSGFAVTVGQHVEAGQLIGYVGATGMVTGPHLHFEVQINGTSVDPMQYLY